MLPILAAQERNNQARIRELRALATPGFRTVFDLVPAILHCNSPALPCHLEDPATPAGILSFGPPPGCPGMRPDASAPPGAPPAVESLLLIGSSGSVGHTARSDLDYWVCYRPSRLPGPALDLFRRKLDLVSEWARSEHGTEANFYTVDLLRLERGQISRGWGQDVDGDAAPLLLLEELYRTLILVAGRIPLWLAAPSGATEEEYLKLAAELAPLEWEGAPPRFVNMGFPRRPQPQEYLAAAMWLTCKSEADPFKGMLKIIPILEAVETNFTSTLLCDVVKEEVIREAGAGAAGGAGKPLAAADPYLITIERVIAYAASSLDPEQTDLIRGAAVLKILGLTGKRSPAAGDGPGAARAADPGRSAGPPAPPIAGLETLPPGAPRPDPAKAAVLERWMRQWDWGPERLARLLAYDTWTERERLMQGNALLILLFSVYMQISNRLMTLFPDQVDAQDEELTPFAARIMGRQRGLEATVDLLPSQFHRDSLPRNLALHRAPDGGTWSIYAVPPGVTEAAEGGRSEGDLVYQAERAVKAAAWLVRNRLEGEGFHICFDPGTGSVDPEAFLDVLEAMGRNFPPVSFKSLDSESIWLVGAQGPVLLAFNFEEPKGTAGIVTLDVVFRTGWGELRHEWTDVGGMASEADKCLALASLLSETCGVADSANLVSVDSRDPASRQMKRAFMNVKGALTASLARAQTPKGATRTLIDL
jgi:adenylate cyclase class 1